MKGKRFTEEQIIGVLKEAEAGAKTKDLCRQYGISDATFYNWKAKYGGLTVSEVRRLRELEQENAKLKKLLAEAERDQSSVEGSAQSKMVGPRVKRQAVDVLWQEHGFGVTRACGLANISRSLYGYQSRRLDCAMLQSRIGELAAQKRRYGYRRIHVLLRREGWEVNWKRPIGFIAKQGSQSGAGSARASARSSANRCRSRPRSTRAGRWTLSPTDWRTVDGSGAWQWLMTIAGNASPWRSTRRSPALVSLQYSNGWRTTAAFPHPLPSIMDPSSKVECWMPGRARVACACRSSGQVSRSTTRISRA